MKIQYVPFGNELQPTEKPIRQSSSISTMPHQVSAVPHEASSMHTGYILRAMKGPLPSDSFVRLGIH